MWVDVIPTVADDERRLARCYRRPAMRFEVVMMLALAAAGCSADERAAPAAAPPRKVEIVAAPAHGELAPYVASEVVRGTRDGVPVLVYVGATWCEPCRDFHAAASSGALDAELGPLRVLELDLDRDGGRLAAAGYQSRLVPLFARPGADGRASGAQTDGVRTGGGYVEQLIPRIRALVATR